MSPDRRTPFPRWFARAAAGLTAAAIGDSLRAAPWAGPLNVAPAQDALRGRFGFAYDRVLGTSLDAQFEAASAREAREGERRVLAEIDRLEKILNARLPASEISRVKAGAAIESTELADVLATYDLWAARTGGALHANLADVVAAWREAAQRGRAPERAALAAAFATPRAFNLDALGKAYIVDRAAAVARELAPAGLLNLGGDIRVWGDTAWMIDVADPRAPADNAAPLTRIPLRNAAVATSGGYARYFTVGATRYSHLIDPRSLRPVAPGRAATVVASDCVTANALATALCVLDTNDGARLAREFAVDFMSLNTSDGTRTTSGASTVGPIAPAQLATDNPMAGAWPTGFATNITVSLKIPDGFRARRPYVAVWVENADHKLVRTLAVWGNGRYQNDLSKFWRVIGGNRSSISSVTRATRAPGSYEVTWDGRDQRGQPVPQGDYTVFLEINREHGHHVWESATVKCGGTATDVEMRETAESDTSTVMYGPPGR